MNRTSNVTAAGFSTAEKWLTGITFTLLTMLACASAAVLLPCMKRHPKFINSLLQIFLGLATGTLIGTSVFQFLPQIQDRDGQLHICHVSAYHIYAGKCHGKAASTGQQTDWLIILGFFMFYLLDHGIRSIQPHQQDVFSTMETAFTTSDTPSAQPHHIEALNSLPIQTRRSSWRAELIRIKPVAWMVLLVECLHKFIDGLSLGCAFSIDVIDGIKVALAIITEELAHGLGDFSILLHANMRPKQAIFAIVLSALPCVAGYVAGMLLEKFEAQNYIFSIAAGTFLYIALACLTPIAIENVSKSIKRRYLKMLESVFGFICGFLISYILDVAV